MKKKLEDKILFLQVRAGSPEAFSELYKKYVTSLYRYIFFKVSSSADAEELTSSVFLKLWGHIKDGNKISNLRSFLYKIARNSVVDYYRTRNGQNTLSLEDIAETYFQSEASLDDQIDTHAQFSEIKDFLGRLKSEYREVIILKYVEGLSSKEIALILNKSQASTRVHIHRAVKSLKQLIDKHKK
jgi:RNA polymerase sigma-70 factor (ECF subfamily)